MSSVDIHYGVLYTADMAHEPGHKLQLASGEDRHEARKEVLLEVLDRWGDAILTQDSGRIDKKKLIEGVTLLGQPIKDFDTIRRWLKKYDWAKQLWEDWLSSFRQTNEEMSIERHRRTLEKMYDIADDPSVKPSERVAAFRAVTSVANYLGLYSKDRTQEVGPKQITLVLSNFQKPIAYKPAEIPADEEIDAEYDVLDDDED